MAGCQNEGEFRQILFDFLSEEASTRRGPPLIVKETQDAHVIEMQHGRHGRHGRKTRPLSLRVAGFQPPIASVRSLVFSQFPIG